MRRGLEVNVIGTIRNGERTQGDAWEVVEQRGLMVVR